jgi:hypothetical protein
VRIIGLRFLRVFTVALLAYLAMVGANAVGMPWLGWSAVVLLFGGYAAFSLFELRKRRRFQQESLWEQAIYDGSRRSQVIAEVSDALSRRPPNRASKRREHARLSVLLAELHDAGGDWSSARTVIDAVSLTGLSQLEAGLVRHTRAVIHLRASDPGSALSVLANRDETGDNELDQRLELLEAYA